MYQSQSFVVAFVFTPFEGTQAGGRARAKKLKLKKKTPWLSKLVCYDSNKRTRWFPRWFIYAPLYSSLHKQSNHNHQHNRHARVHCGANVAVDLEVASCALALVGGQGGVGRAASALVGASAAKERDLLHTRKKKKKVRTTKLLIISYRMNK